MIKQQSIVVAYVQKLDASAISRLLASATVKASESTFSGAGCLPFLGAMLLFCNIFFRERVCPLPGCSAAATGITASA